MRDAIRVGEPRWGSDSDMESCAAALRGKQRTSGINFASVGSRPGKDSARDRLISMFTLKRWPGQLRILTMPGLAWPFEKCLLKIRGGMAERGPMPERLTQIHAIEREPAIFQASLGRLPAPSLTIRVEDPPPWAVGLIHTRAIASFTCCELGAWLEAMPAELDAAWIDLCGPPSVDLLRTIRDRLWASRSLRLLAITGMNCRGSAHLSRQLAGREMAPFLAQYLPDCAIEQSITYADGAAMFQAVLRKTS